MTIRRMAGNARMSNAVIYNGITYTKGVTPIDINAGIEDQTRDVLDQIDTILSDAGTSKEKALKVMIWITDMRDFDAMNSVYDAWISAGNKPVRACVETTLAVRDMKVEIQVEAAV